MITTHATERSRTHAVVYLRSLAPSVIDETREHLSRLDRFVEEGTLDAYEVELWGDAIACDPTYPAGKHLCETVERFERWAERRDCSLEPAFSRGQVCSLVSEETHDVIRLPMVCLAVYEGERLTAVYPHRDGSTRTVADGLDEVDRHSASDLVAAGA
ncbi:HTH domain-containing protein [Natronorarus salvus]|uniref:HTH domain-containing protein n=1 Tax=Natronorarus salvus TaxID=3117733 RepID=UPI002F269D19